jgi:hypothetical protein
MLLAAGSGLWLYHVKHKSQVLDRQIENTIRAAATARERTTMLRADWALLNDPQRLQQLASNYLQLRPIAPTQFVQLSQLDARLPPVPPPAANAAPGATPATPAGADALIAQTAPTPAHDAPPTDASAALAAAVPPPVKVAAAAPRVDAPPPVRHPVAVADARPLPPRRAPIMLRPPAYRPPADRPPRARAPVYRAYATQQTTGQPILRRVEALAGSRRVQAGPYYAATSYTGSALGDAGPLRLAPPVPMAVNAVVTPPGR